jgi:hypothetical protein
MVGKGGNSVSGKEIWSYLSTGFNVVLDHRHPCHREQWFGHLKRQRPEASPWERREHCSLLPPSAPTSPSTLAQPSLLTLLRASNQDHSFEHDGDCYLNFKPQ